MNPLQDLREMEANTEHNKDILITKNIDGFYLLYNNNKHSNNDNYILFSPDSVSRYSCTESPKSYDDLLANISDVFDEAKLPNDLRVIYTTINANVNDADSSIGILTRLFIDLADVHYYITEEENEIELTKRIDAIDDERIIERIESISKQNAYNILNEKIGDMYDAFKTRKGVKKAIRDLGNYLNKEMGIILRKNSHTLYKLDELNNGYNSTDIDEIISELTKIFDEDNLFNTTDVENAVNYISERLIPEYNIVKFNNGLYDMKQHKLIKPDKPIFTLVESPFNYNPNAKPEYITDYLESTFERDTEKATATEIKGVLQVIGYLFTSGNVYNTLIFLVGIGGAGKGTLASIIAEIFKGITTQLDFSKIEKNDHATSILIDKHLNIVRETRTGVVEDNTTYKLLSGNDSIDVNPKNKTPYELPAEEVPKSLMNANNLPNFKNPDLSILQRFVLIEFKRIFRNTTDDVRDLAKLIINSTDDMEWLIYNGLEAYKEMVEANEDFILRLSEEETLDLLYKHSKPLNYLVRKLILKHDTEAYEDEVETPNDDGQSEFKQPYVIATELNSLIVYLAKKEGIQIPMKSENTASSTKLLNAIRDEFDLHDYHHQKYTTTTKRVNGKSQRVYPDLIKTDAYNKLYDEMIEAKDETGK